MHSRSLTLQIFVLFFFLYDQRHGYIVIVAMAFSARLCMAGGGGGGGLGCAESHGISNQPENSRPNDLPSIIKLFVCV